MVSASPLAQHTKRSRGRFAPSLTSLVGASGDEAQHRLAKCHQIGSWKTPSAGRQGRRRRTGQGAAEPRGETARNPRRQRRYHQRAEGVKGTSSGIPGARSQRGVRTDRPTPAPAGHAITGSGRGRSPVCVQRTGRSKKGSYDHSRGGSAAGPSGGSGGARRRGGGPNGRGSAG